MNIIKQKYKCNGSMVTKLKRKSLFWDQQFKELKWWWVYLRCKNLFKLLLNQSKKN